jgi:metal-responsive CopG/Arc/MetJ family transcriptional regulator
VTIKRASSIVRRSVALPRPLVEEVMAAAKPEARHNLNRLVVSALREYVAARKARAFEQAMAQMAADPAIRKECAAIAREFAPAESDGLDHD